MFLILTALCAILFALIHILIGRLHLLEGDSRGRALSAAAGGAAAYVFLHILPALNARHEQFASAFDASAQNTDRWIYLAALLGLVTFYGLEHAVRRSRAHSEAAGESAAAPGFILHLGAFALFNVLIGYLLLHREENGLASLAAYLVAISLHFVTGDFALRRDHRARYDRWGRWLLAGAVMLGWALGVLVTVHAAAIGIAFAFLAGVIILNVLKEELPDQRNSRFWPFVAGAGLFGVLLMLI